MVQIYYIYFIIFYIICLLNLSQNIKWLTYWLYILWSTLFVQYLQYFTVLHFIVSGFFNKTHDVVSLLQIHHRTWSHWSNCSGQQTRRQPWTERRLQGSQSDHTYWSSWRGHTHHNQPGRPRCRPTCCWRCSWRWTRGCWCLSWWPPRPQSRGWCQWAGPWSRLMVLNLGQSPQWFLWLHPCWYTYPCRCELPWWWWQCWRSRWGRDPPSWDRKSWVPFYQWRIVRWKWSTSL